MDDVHGNRPARRRLRIKPLRLIAAVVLALVVATALLIVPRTLAFLLRVPAASPLGQGEGSGYTAAVSLPYAGRCLAMRAAADGTAFAAALGDDGLTVYAAFPEGSHVKAQCSLSGEIGPVALLPSGYLLVWTTERAGGGGGALHAFGPLTKSTLARTPLAPAWTLRLDRGGAALLPLPAGAAALHTSGDGVPDGLLLVSDAGRKGFSAGLTDGVYTAWDSAGVSGMIALGGARYTGGKQSLTPFVTAYSPGGAQGMTTGEISTAPLRIAVSATGSHVLTVTRDRLTMFDSGGRQIWARSLPGDVVRTVHVFPDGRSFVAGPDAGISLDDRGHVLRRWGLTGLGAVSRPGPAEAMILSLPGGAAAIDSTGKVIARVLWEGPSQMVAADPAANWLLRADGTALTLYQRK